MIHQADLTIVILPEIILAVFAMLALLGAVYTGKDKTTPLLVAPLIPLSQGPTPISRLEPILEIGGIAHLLHTGELAAVPATLLKGTRSFAFVLVYCPGG